MGGLYIFRGETERGMAHTSGLESRGFRDEAGGYDRDELGGYGKQDSTFYDGERTTRNDRE